MESSERNNPILEECDERVILKREFCNVVKHYSMLIDMIESSQQARITAKANKEYKCIKRLFNKLKIT